MPLDPTADPAAHDPLQMRLRRIEGQIQGVQRMLSQDRACEDVLNQLLAIRAAVEQVCLMMTEEHLRNCVLSNESLDPARLEEILETVRLVLRAGGARPGGGAGRGG